MFSRIVSEEKTAQLLDLPVGPALRKNLSTAGIKPVKSKGKAGHYRIGDIVVFKLAQIINHIGVDAEKALIYAETILESRLEAHDSHLLEWIENEAQELFCIIADDQLARIFLRNKEDDREIDVAAIKPMLFPTTVCEINVFRVIRPVILHAHQLS
jgi:hypothetical protein